MAKQEARWNPVVQLENIVAGSAIVTTTSSTEKTDARLAFFRSGLFIITMNTTDVSSGNETYVFTLEGRMVGSGGYTVLATISLAAPTTLSNTTWVTSVPLFFKRLRVTATLGGTTPSAIYAAHVVALHSVYHPKSSDAVI